MNTVTNVERTEDTDEGETIAVTILGSENCQSISFQNLLSASHLFMLCDLHFQLRQ